jgi:serine-type D-Ala-D-Ala endopeptidase (penicillin-binding protein 7)
MRKIITILASIIICNVAYSKQKEPSVLHFDVSEKRIVYDQNINKVRPIASVTKLMTAMVSLDYSNDMNKQLKLIRTVSSSLPTRTYTRQELFEAMLIRSDNAAAETLASDYPGGRQSFIEAMNKKSKSLGMNSTHFRDPTGLSVNNVSTANELVDMVIASSSYEIITQNSIKKQTLIETKHKKKIRKIVLNNTNRLILFEFDNVIVSKTGYTTPAGFCVAIVVEQKEKKKREVTLMKEIFGYFSSVPIEKDEIVVHRHVIVILGSKNPKERVDRVKEIMYNNLLDTEFINTQ